MVSLWGSKNGGDDQPRSGDATPPDAEGSRHSSQRQQDPDERTRLLPPPRRDGYLDPDDPAVCLSTSTMLVHQLASRIAKLMSGSRSRPIISGASELSAT